MHTTSRRRPLRRRVAAAAFVAAAALVSIPGPAFAAPRIAVTPQTFTVTEGDAQDVVFALSEPIISSDPNPDVTLSFTVGDPSRISVSPSTLHWDAGEWFQPRTLHVTAIHDGVYDASNTVGVQVLTTSASEYYSGYTTSFTATIDDIDPAPTTTTVATTTTTIATTTIAPTTTVTVTDVGPTNAPGPPSTAAGPRLAITGGAVATPTVAGFACVAAGALLLAIGRPRRRDDGNP